MNHLTTEGRLSRSPSPEPSPAPIHDSAANQTGLHLTWITPKWPLPADDGAKQATTQLLRQLARAGTAIHLCSIVPEGVTIEESAAIASLGVKEVTIVRRRPTSPKAHLRNLVLRPRASLTLAPYDSPEIAAQLRRAVDRTPGTYVVYDGLHSAAWAHGADGSRTPTAIRGSIYRAHNVERDLWFRAAERKVDPLSRGFLRAQGHRVGALEAVVSRQAIAVFPVSDPDAEHFRRIAPRTPVVSIPIGIDVARAERPAGAVASETGKLSILFVGKLDWAPNRDGLRWLLEKAWPKASERRPDLELVIVGSGDGTWLKPFLDAKSIRFLGRVDTVAPHYEACTASVVPVFYGSGTRVKAIESSLHERACIGTELGVEGIGLVPGQSYLRAETEEDWVRALVELTPARAREIAAAARECVSQKFDSEIVARRFLAALTQEIHSKRTVPEALHP